MELLSKPWPWYIAGPLIGLTVPVLLLMGNKNFGISSTLRHICAACIPARLPFFQYDWKREIWNIVFILGVLLGGVIARQFIGNPNPVIVSDATTQDLAKLNIAVDGNLLPTAIFKAENVFTRQGFVFLVLGGFLVGFGTRYAGGCTSGHSIMGLSSLQWPSLVATVCFMVGGIITTHLLLPWLLKL